MTVSLLERQQTFGGSSLLSLRRGAGHVPDTPQNSGVPTSAPISLLQLQNATKTTPLTASANGIGGSANGTAHNLGTSTVTASGGTGSYSYSISKVSGSGLITVTQPGAANTATFSVSATRATQTAVWRWTVSDGQSTVTVDINVTANGTL